VENFLVRILDHRGATWHAQLMMREISVPNSACEELVREYIRPHFELLQSILDELVPAETSPTKRHLIAFSIVGQCLHYLVAKPIVWRLIAPDELETYTPAVLADHITELTLAALGNVSSSNGCIAGQPGGAR
jgi:hypothetical protein